MRRWGMGYGRRLGYIIGPILGGLIAQLYSDITVPFVFLGGMLLALIVPAYLMQRQPSSYAVVQNLIDAGKHE